uniref:Arf-GAP with GTPase, ANK repeat and PH domain-containing protein 3 n=1 Tax=Lygus hesperus TaxID=30085 RepID=A0A0A9W9P6_LYGHE
MPQLFTSVYSKRSNEDATVMIDRTIRNAVGVLPSKTHLQQSSKACKSTSADAEDDASTAVPPDTHTSAHYPSQVAMYGCDNVDTVGSAHCTEQDGKVATDTTATLRPSADNTTIDIYATTAIEIKKNTTVVEEDGGNMNGKGLENQVEESTNCAIQHDTYRYTMNFLHQIHF